MTEFVAGCLVVAMIAVVGVLGAGLITMARGNDVTGVKSNRLMWWRVCLQGIALALFAIVLVLTKKSGS